MTLCAFWGVIISLVWLFIRMVRKKSTLIPKIVFCVFLLFLIGCLISNSTANTG